MKKHFNLKKLGLILIYLKNPIFIMRLTVFLLLISVFQVFASGNNAQNTNNLLQPITVTGTVTDAQTGDPLPGVNIVIEGTTQGTATDMNGNYSIEASNDDVLIFSFIGYTQKSIDINGRQEINVALEPAATELVEVVAIGYESVRRRNITSSVGVIDGETIKEDPVADISQSLNGNVPGVMMRQMSGEPGAENPDIYIRGVGTIGENDPLVVIDGIPRDNMGQIDPNSIESITVLKDAAAVAPYGLAGANGVILITTKSGKTGAPVLNVSGFYGIQNPTYLPDLLDAQDFMRMHNECYLNEHPGDEEHKPYEDEFIQNYPQLHEQDPDKYPSTNYKQIMNFNVPIQKYNVDLSGGTEGFNYYAGLGYIDQQGVFDPVYYKRYNYNVKLDIQATKTTKVNAAILGSSDIKGDTDPGDWSSDHLFRSNFKYKPTAAYYYTNGKWGQFAGNSPIGVLNAGYNKNEGSTVLTKLTVEQQLPFIEGLSVKGTFSYDRRNNFIKGYHTPFYFWSINTNTDPYTYNKEISTAEGAATTFSWLRQEQQKRDHFTYQGYIDYENTFGKHAVSGLAVVEARNHTYIHFDARRDQFSVDVDELDMGSSKKDNLYNGGMSEESAQIGYVFRVGDIYADKYIVNLSGRYDGHYYFAPGKRWAFFPAVSLGWRISNENFMQGISFIDDLKLRGSWGKSGNLAGDPYQYLSGYELEGGVYAFGDGSFVEGAETNVEANPFITWEKSTKTDVGFDATLWNHFLTFGADYFHEKRTGMLLEPQVTVPIEYGLDLAEENAGIMETYGVEFSIGTRYRFNNDLQVSFNGNFSYSTNEMIEMFETDATYNNPNRRRTGRPRNTQFGYHALGLFSTEDDKDGDGIINSEDGYDVEQFGELHPGDIKYEDISGPDGEPDGKIDANDRVVIGDPTYPAIVYGFTPSLRWKGFDLTVFFQGAAKVGLNTYGFQTVPFYNNDSNTDYEYFNDHWTPETQDATYPRATSAPYSNNIQTSDFWYKDASYLRLKTANLGYTLPRTVTNTVNIQSIRIYASARNILTFSKIDFMDPEQNPENPMATYPTQYSVNFGVDIVF